MSLLKVGHLFFLFLWLGSLIVLTRAVVYQARTAPHFHIQFADLTAHLYRWINLPAMILALITGLALFPLSEVTTMRSGWFHMKLLFVIMLVLCDLLFGYLLFRIRRNRLIVRFQILYGSLLHWIAIWLLIGSLTAIYVVKPKELLRKSKAQKNLIISPKEAL